MSFQYHAQSLKKDVSYLLGCIAGRGNIAVVKKRLQAMRDQQEVGDLEDAVAQLATYFEELCAGLGSEALALGVRQELQGELLDGAEAEQLARAQRRRIQTTITKTEAKHLAELIAELTNAWGR